MEIFNNNSNIVLIQKKGEGKMETKREREETKRDIEETKRDIEETKREREETKRKIVLVNVIRQGILDCIDAVMWQYENIKVLCEDSYTVDREAVARLIDFVTVTGGRNFREKVEEVQKEVASQGGADECLKCLKEVCFLLPKWGRSEKRFENLWRMTQVDSGQEAPAGSLYMEVEGSVVAYFLDMFIKMGREEMEREVEEIVKLVTGGDGCKKVMAAEWDIAKKAWDAAVEGGKVKKWPHRMSYDSVVQPDRGQSG
jgi:hypothetical protein